MADKKSVDRHRVDSVQLKLWLPRIQRARFTACCHGQGVPAATVLRDLMDAYCNTVEAVQAPAEGSDGPH